jgi:Tfp pilus assembly protein PilN
VIRTNLSTRPFYNEGVVHVWLLAVTVVVIAATVFNVSRVIKYSRSDTELAMQASANEARAADLRAAASHLRATIDTKQVDVASTEAREANELIDRRTFSWTDLLNRFETTLPDNVRITAVRNKLDPKRGIVLTIDVAARSVDDVNGLMDRLEETGAFTDLLTPDEHVDSDGTLVAVVETTYRSLAVPRNDRGAKRP